MRENWQNKSIHGSSDSDAVHSGEATPGVPGLVRYDWRTVPSIPRDPDPLDTTTHLGPDRNRRATALKFPRLSTGTAPRQAAAR